jgi:DNA mismatch repair protein MutH
MNHKLSLCEVQQKLSMYDFSSVQKPTRDKGLRGKHIEEALGIKNSSNLTDMVDGELKSFSVGETIAVTSIKHCLSEIIDEPLEFEDTKVAEKMRQVLYIAFTRKNEYIGNITINQDSHSKHYQHLAEDYGYISAQIRAHYVEGKELNTITGPNNLLQIRTKASKNKSGGYTPLCHNGVQLKDKAMAFYLCSNFGKTIL